MNFASLFFFPRQGLFLANSTHLILAAPCLDLFIPLTDTSLAIGPVSRERCSIFYSARSLQFFNIYINKLNVRSSTNAPTPNIEVHPLSSFNYSAVGTGGRQKQCVDSLAHLQMYQDTLPKPVSKNTQMYHDTLPKPVSENDHLQMYQDTLPKPVSKNAGCFLSSSSDVPGHSS